jgi:hypothetical protein
MTFSFTLDEEALSGKIIEADVGGNYAGSGVFTFQNPVQTFNSTSISGSFVFSLAGPAGTGASSVHKGVIGRLDLVKGQTSTTGTIANTSTSDDESNDPTETLTGTYTLDGATNDHGTLSITTAPAVSTPTVSFYVINKGNVYALETDPNAAASNKGILLGDANKIALANNGNPLTFDNTALAGPFIFSALGSTPSTAANGQGHASAIVGRFSGAAGAVGGGTVTGTFDQNDGGTVPANRPLSILGTNGQTPGSFTIAANGRGVLNISTTASGGLVNLHFVFYAGSLSFGVLLEQPASDNSNRGRNGEWVAQTVTAPITNSGVNATFIGGTRADTAASLHSVGVFQINGSVTPGTFAGTGDDSQAGFPPQFAGAATGTFGITDQNTGRGTLTATTGSIAGSAGAVFYVDDPGEIIVIGTDATLKEPQIITLDQ